MRIALVADVFPPARTSGAVQLRDLADELVRSGHKVTVMVPDAGLASAWAVEDMNGVEVVRLRSFKTKDIDYARRTLAELAMPYIMRYRLKRSPLANRAYDGVIWYSPTIFMGPLVRWLKKHNQCQSYLILRDIFPEWAADMQLMKRGLPFRFFQRIANYQYASADIIGVQTPGNLEFFRNGRFAAKIEVLHNWLSPNVDRGCRIEIEKTALSGRKILVYAGNMGVAQGTQVLLDLAETVKHDPSIGFVFVGRGSDVPKLMSDATARALDNILFFDEIDPDEIAGLYAQARVGLVALDQRHRTHNIPGKFISYMHAGLPVLAIVNPGNDLAAMIAAQKVGVVSVDATDGPLAELIYSALDLSEQPDTRLRCRELAAALFSAKSAARQIVGELQEKRMG